MLKKIMRHGVLAIASSMLPMLFADAALAQSFPNKPVKLVIPYPAGAPVDNVARGLGEVLSALWGQPVLIDNRAGANEIVAASAVGPPIFENRSLTIAIMAFEGCIRCACEPWVIGSIDHGFPQLERRLAA